MALVLRFFVVLFAFWLASLGAAAVLVLGVSAPELPAANDWPLVSVLIFTTSAFVAAFSFAPAIVVILLAESFSFRSVLIYALAGAAVGLFCGYTLGFVERAPRFQVQDPFGTNFELMTAAGIAAGLVYWLAAGRTAGAWRQAPAAERTTH